MTSLFVRTRSGAKIPFDLAMLEQSLLRAAQEIGETDAFVVRSLAEQAAEQVLPLSDVSPEVATTDIQAAVVHSLREKGNMLLAEAYERYHAPAPIGSEAAPVAQPMAFSSSKHVHQPAVTTVGESHAPRRRRLSEERKAITHKFRVGDQEGYITVGLQYGVPLKVLARKFMNVQFAPQGETENPNIPSAHSIIDYVFRWLALKFLTPEERQAIQDELEQGHVALAPAALEESIGRLSL